jgi:hypothetical protein
LAGLAAIERSGVAQVSTGGSQITQQWLDQQLIKWKPAQNHSLAFGTLFPRASYGNLQLSYNTAAVQNANLAMLMSSNVKCIRIDIGYAPWLQSNKAPIDEMTSLVQQVKSEGRCLIIADAASETYRGGGRLTWTQFQQVWPQRVSTLASLYHPDYYIVIKEPGWYVPMVSDAATNPDFQNLNKWTNLTQTLASAVISASPNTKVGVALAADSLNGANGQGYISYLNEVKKMTNISFIGYDIYTVTGFNATQSFLTTYGNGSKDVWIAEAWSGDGSFVFDASRAQLDREWMQVLYYFGMQVNATMILPFYTDLLSSYSFNNSSPSPTNSAQIVSLYQQRTPVFYELQGVVASGGVASTTTISSTTSSTTSSSSTSSSASTPSSSTSSTKLTSTGGLVSLSSSSPTAISTTTTAASGGRLSALVVAFVGLIALIGAGLAIVFLRRRK